MKKQIIIMSVFLICCISCASQKREVIASSTIKLESENTNIRDLLDIDGVFNFSTVFYEDGTWVIFSMRKNKEDRIDNLFNYIDTWNEKKQIRWGTYWGVYKIKKDTIIVHSYDKGNFVQAWWLEERRYRVIDRKTVQLIYSKGLLHESVKYAETNNISSWVDIDKNPVHFTPADSLPSSDCWLKEEKWIWRNESDWRAYMQHVEQVKKQYKKK
jgi:hypothetical protein